MCRSVALKLKYVNESLPDFTENRRNYGENKAENERPEEIINTKTFHPIVNEYNHQAINDDCKQSEGNKRYRKCQNVQERLDNCI